VAGEGLSTVTVEPSGVTFPVEPGETVMAAANRQGFRWPTVCGGNASCGACLSLVADGDESCGPVEGEEAETLARVARITAAGTQRLACRLTLTGDVRLTRRGVRPVAPAAQAT
jgi:ferredoxin, 2Fe-2S